MEAEQGEFRGSLGHFVCISVPAGSLHLVVSITEGTGTQISLLRGISGAVGEEEPAQLTAQGLSVPPRGRERRDFPWGKWSQRCEGDVQEKVRSFPAPGAVAKYLVCPDLGNCGVTFW